MILHDFRLVLEVPPNVAADPSGDHAEDLSNELYEAGCDDGSLGMHCGVWEITLHREAANVMDAVHSAIRQVESVGCRVVRVESPDQPFFDRVNEELANRRQPAATADQ